MRTILAFIVLSAFVGLIGCGDNDSEIGDYVVQKANEDGHLKILVVSNITKSGSTKSVAELMKNDENLMFYHIDDYNLYKDLRIGEKVTVRPKTSIVDGKQVDNNGFIPSTDICRRSY
ncbi:hypothetical protein SD71_15050 [Cohnella kolymensis]|uniref:DUF3221 domain-containing protein n=1 Tax=Cohnella kolymensis TaxID=1590652 RepID=A0ABR5A2Z2_9BACL|nr:DUF3221 domain-containing protein [Cohnella kolymensis]KIL34998.1 hypothetical protein SD71_15050 [Cohnella kolymensis]